MTKLYILASNTDKSLLTKQDGFSSEEIAPRTYLSLSQAERFAAKFNASVYSVYVNHRHNKYAIRDYATGLGINTNSIVF